MNTKHRSYQDFEPPRFNATILYGGPSKLNDKMEKYAEEIGALNWGWALQEHFVPNLEFMRRLSPTDRRVGFFLMDPRGTKPLWYVGTFERATGHLLVFLDRGYDVETVEEAWARQVMEQLNAQANKLQEHLLLYKNEIIHFGQTYGGYLKDPCPDTSTPSSPGDKPEPTSEGSKQPASST